VILKLVRTPGIYLVGFMGSGKSTIGRLLADELGWNFADTDEDIETCEGATIIEIFEKRGEVEFRRIESEAIRKRVAMVERGRPHVLALGGGAFTIEANVRLLNDNGVTLWLDCPLDVVRSRVAGERHRPLARDPERFAVLYRERRASYGKADFRVEAAGDAPTVVASILNLPIF
jgi:shikimate kinase